MAEQARKRAAAATHHKNAKELQKKMGKALLKSIAESKDKAEKAKEEQRIKDEEEAAKRKASSTKERKSVKFAEPDSEDEGERKEDWGDVVPGKIKPMKRPNLLSQSTTKETMKMNVVERRPARPVSPPRPTVPDKDSDDESDVAPPSDDELQSDNELEEEADFDFANLQRQVQLEYYRKRATIGQDAASLIQTASEPEPELTTVSYPLSVVNPELTVIAGRYIGHYQRRIVQTCDIAVSSQPLTVRVWNLKSGVCQ